MGIVVQLETVYRFEKKTTKKTALNRKRLQAPYYHFGGLVNERDTVSDGATHT